MNERDEALVRLAETPRYRALLRARGRFAAILTAIVLFAYFGFILLVAFDPAFLGTSLSGGATTIGVPIGLGVIVLAIALTALYVWRANAVYDSELAALAREFEA